LKRRSEVVVSKRKPISTCSEWTFELIEEYYNEIERIARDKFGISYYPNQLEVISSEQMLDAYASVAMPIMYNHWSFGKQFVYQHEHYKRGRMGLAYEVVINSNPCIAYLMEENSMTMQALVTAHASFGHNSFFKNNYLFKQWTDAEAIIDYLSFAKKYIATCEEKYGIEEVEEVLDSCHALQHYGVDKYKRPPQLSIAEEKARQTERNDYLQSQLNELWNTVPTAKTKTDKEKEHMFPSEPQENILYFIEKNAPNMPTWKRELIRIVRKMAQYFYPQMQTKLMNEGWATFWHYTLITELYEEGLVNDGFMLEFYDNHTAVVAQLPYWHPQYNGINVYALGFAMYQDIKRICMEPTEEDKEWFPEFAGNGDWNKTVHWAMENFKDESFVMQFLSPKVIRDFKLFSFIDDDKDSKLEISAIHNKNGYKKIREKLSNQYNVINYIPDIQVTNVDRWGDRSLTLRHYMSNRKPLDEKNSAEVLKHLHRLWGFGIKLESTDERDKIRATYEILDDDIILDIFMDDGDD
jgi:stage V sporulation protein R